MKKSNHTPGPWTITPVDQTNNFKVNHFNGSDDPLIATVNDAPGMAGGREYECKSNALLISSAPELNERLLDNTAMIMRLHCVMSTEFVTPEDMKQKLQSMQNDIELCVVKNRDVLTKANGNENT